MITCAEALVRLLEGYGVDTLFGIPGVHTVPLYRALAGSRLKHVTPRHEQGAGFMADGYARVARRPGVCFIITGPGMTNIATAMGQAYADSIPMLVISSVNRREHLRLGHGRLHELPDQRALVAGVSAFSHTLNRPDELPEVLARAFAVFGCARPRPVHIEIPLDVLDADASHVDLTPRAIPAAPSAPLAVLDALRARLAASRRRVLLAGGGAVGAGPLVQALAERLGAPVALTVNARGLLPPDHPLLLDGVQSFDEGRQLFDEADLVVAIGTELGETDYDFFGKGPHKLRAPLVRIDIDPFQALGAHPAALPVVGDARAVLHDLLATSFDVQTDLEWAHRRVAQVNAAVRAHAREQDRRFDALLTVIRDAAPDTIVAGDSTQPVYRGAIAYRATASASWFNSSTGYGTLGYGLPAAIGAKLAQPARPVVALVGDGGVQFSVGELACAREARAGIAVVVWNSRGYQEIRDAMCRADVPPLGVDVEPPDFRALAAAYDIAYCAPANLAELRALLAEQHGKTTPGLLEIDASRFSWEAQ
ncbi:5-guanidino-2-oxopentanoate decarboxylase [Paraburkholderia pallida]|uniref:5-guanidino-2-oxopentanoate decarboxylase n=1 Tax=Paraburkholderia pallida TaxID=2547399 RepID=A0A4P7CX49_9BURK|nr:5-guanidino-2-oxopentanoate decarboxylase [Paraburkholderia pallida]QBQ98849.1 5-guanidino-2-oxopentanoate decarboxylase [Paraburkholderia pallida]